MPKSAGYLKGARVHPYDGGLILTYPTPYLEAGTPIIRQPKYGRVFRQAEKWASILGVSYVADLNNLLRNGGIEEFINVNEALHERTIAEIAQTIASQPRVRIVLVAGPSSSGKTTFASRLAVHLKVLGRRCQPISVDDYYKDREDIPLMPDGKPDFECIEALDTEKLSEDLNLLLSGEEARIPRFDFIEGHRCGLVPLRIRDDILIIEGIHGLNNALTAGVDDAYKFRIFISPLTTLNIDSHSVVIPEDMRLLRRLVRDKRTRGYSFAQTLAIWNSVRHGEYKYILPYQENADVMFNSTLLYEGLILKKYAYSELKSIMPDMENYPEALGLLKFLNYFLTLDDESLVPRQSILREFIGR
jgi:uridine kinase